MASSSDLVLITGGSSFIGLHALHQALQQGFRVRTTIRNEAKRSLIEAALKDYDASLDYTAIEYAHADLLSDAGWDDAARGARYVLHVASPFPAAQPKDEMELIRPAREGTLRVLRAAKRTGTCTRVVVTSSVAAVAYGNTPSEAGVFTEADWTNVDGPHVSAYVKSKTLAEQAAWDFVKSDEGSGLELATVNPVGVFGPPMRPEDGSTTCDIVKALLKGEIPLAPRIGFGIVDVRDVASLLLLAMVRPEANGERYLATAAPQAMSLLECGAALRSGLGQAASRTPTRELPDWFVRFGARFSGQLKAAADNLGKQGDVSNEKARALGWAPKTPEEALVATGQRFIDKGFC
ncbi:dihydroflavonol-4-reductase protein [Acaromyces ingoldii]|uniref:Dihydroflavonol-4-reductase protein n=1 Tax=Acaromyces ingoldii TaxID=215250 RepID=A0A316YNY1_9BASI|nr:dihydroflavonol-4-reductase protein [Acaromyces ingoldii]PWN91087.1 dihydroflavonol-4-reductase protein [Acaromyces ingoldii]